MKVDEGGRGGEKVEPNKIVLSRTLTGEKGECHHDSWRRIQDQGVRAL